jgi:hypothetical protein
VHKDTVCVENGAVQGRVRVSESGDVGLCGGCHKEREEDSVKDQRLADQREGVTHCQGKQRQATLFLPTFPVRLLHR